MTRTPIWKSIALTLQDDIAQGRYATGQKLPAEAQLSSKFGVNRHTVRRALAELAEQGLVHARRGAGVFVTARPTDYPLGSRVRFHQNIRRAGRSPGKEILLLESRLADADEAALLDLTAGDTVLVYEGLSFVDGTPVALAQTIFPEPRLPGLKEAMSAESSITEALRAAGVADYTRQETRITATLATPIQALHLRLAEGAPILRTTSLSVDRTGMPVEFGRTWFAGDRITLTLDDA